MKNSIVQLTTVLFAFAALTFLVSYTRPSADEAKEYTVIFNRYSQADFEKQVNQKISEGWRLQGGVSSNGAYYVQAFVK